VISAGGAPWGGGAPSFPEPAAAGLRAAEADLIVAPFLFLSCLYSMYCGLSRGPGSPGDSLFPRRFLVCRAAPRPG
jgi:hypothetical protein